MRKMVVLLAVALVAGCVSEKTYQQEVQQVGTLSAQNKTYQQLNQQLQSEVRTDQVQITQLQDRLKVTMVDQLLFPEGGWQIHRAGEATLNKIIPTLTSLQNQRIVVEGFTDNVPIGPELRNRFPSNWELSTARATDVVRYLAAQGVNPNILSAQGFGDTQPVASNDTAQGRAKNRRVEIVIMAAGSQTPPAERVA
jgi:chemotaxis protein MotB